MVLQGVLENVAESIQTANIFWSGAWSTEVFMNDCIQVKSWAQVLYLSGWMWRMRTRFVLVTVPHHHYMNVLIFLYRTYSLSLLSGRRVPKRNTLQLFCSMIGWLTWFFGQQDSAAASGYFELLSVLHLLGMLALQEANSCLTPRPPADGYNLKANAGMCFALHPIFSFGRYISANFTWYRLSDGKPC